MSRLVLALSFDVRVMPGRPVTYAGDLKRQPFELKKK